MTHHTTLDGTARQLPLTAIALVVVATGTAAAHGGTTSGGMMGGGMSGGWGLFGGAMGLWGLLWMGLLVAIPLALGYALLGRESGGTDEQPLSVLRERYARGDLSDEEYERRRNRLERSG